MTDLNIPDAADRAFLTAQSDAYGDRHTGVAYRQGLAAAARLIVAAELHRLADWHWGTSSGGDDICEALQARADELVVDEDLS